MIIRPKFVLAVLLAAPLLLHAQAADTPKNPSSEASHPPSEESFLATLTLKILDHAKKTTDQSYSLAIRTTPKSSSVREGNRIPIVSGTEGHTDQVQYQYIDLGTNIDMVNVKRVGSLIAIDIKVEISATAAEIEGKLGPTIRDAKYSVNPAVPVGKQVTVYSSTDGVTGRKVEIQILVEPIPAA